MTEIQFDPSKSLIILDVDLEYKVTRTLKLALDTGSSKMLITPYVARIMGYNIDNISKSKSLTTATREEQVVMIDLRSVSIGTEKVYNLEASVKELPEALKIDGVVGLNYLKYFKTTIDYSTGILTLQRIQP